MNRLVAPILGVKGFTKISSGEYLFLHRKVPQPSGSVWDTPGGHIEPGESVEAAFARELGEEAGMALGGIESFVYFQPQGEDALFERWYVRANAVGSIVLGPEHDDYLLVQHPADALSLPGLDPHISMVIEEWLAEPWREVK